MTLEREGISAQRGEAGMLMSALSTSCATQEWPRQQIDIVQWHKYSD